MSSAIQEPAMGTTAQGPAGRPPTGRRRRRAALLAGVVLVVAAAIVIAAADPFGGGNSAARTTSRDAPGTLATVTRGTLSQQVNSSGTLGYVAQADGSPYQVVNQASGAFTQLPTAGQTVGCGQTLYHVANNPVVLLCGSTPAYRSLSEGDSGPDVKELNANLVRLGYATSSELDPTSDYFSSETAYALEQLQDKLGEDQTGTLKLGQAVFLPGPLRVSKTTASLGSMAHPGAPVVQATSTARQVEVDLDASEQGSVKVGDSALITLPDNQTTAGTVTRIGTVATAPSSGSGSPGSGSGSSTPTIPIYIALKHPAAAGRLDEAPVQVQITTAGIKHALIVPVDALVAEQGGRYAVETVSGHGAHHLVPVTLGAFDDANGTVQVTGNLQPGDQVKVPSV